MIRICSTFIFMVESGQKPFLSGIIYLTEISNNYGINQDITLSPEGGGTDETGKKLKQPESS